MHTSITLTCDAHKSGPVTLGTFNYREPSEDRSALFAGWFYDGDRTERPEGETTMPASDLIKAMTERGGTVSNLHREKTIFRCRKCGDNVEIGRDKREQMTAALDLIAAHFEVVNLSTFRGTYARMR